MKRSILPARPLRIKFSTRLATWCGVLALLAIGLGCGFGVYYEIKAGGHILAEQRVWEHGVPAQDGEVRAKRTSKLIPWLVANYDGTATYVDASGITHHGEIDFWTMFGGPDVDTAEIRYDADHPDQFATSWGVGASGARWRSLVVMTLILLGCTWAGFMGAWWVANDDRKRSQVAKRGDEVILRVISSSAILDKKGQPSGKFRYQLELDVNGEAKQIARDARTLLTCASDDQRVVGLWIPDDTTQLLVVHSEDLAPLAISRAEWQEVTMRAAQAT